MKKRSGKIQGCTLMVIVMVLFLSLVMPLQDSLSLTKVTTKNYRVSGHTKFDTAYAIANALYKSHGPFDNIIVTFGDNYPDALSGGYLAKIKKAPLILINPEWEDEALSYISTHMKSDGKVYLLGGSRVVSRGFEDAIKERGVSYKRLSGQSLYDTNMEILKETGVGDGEILLCTGKGFVDSLSAAAVGKPIMLVDKTLRADQLAFLRNNNIKKIYIIGGSKAVSTQVFNSAKAIAPTERVGGTTCYDTSVNIARKFFGKGIDTAVLTTSRTYTDGLSGGPFAMDIGAPLIVVSDGIIPTAASDYVREKNITTSYTLGGNKALSNDTVKRVMDRYIDDGESKTSIGNIGTAEDVLNVMRSWLGYSEANGKHKIIVDIYNSITPLPAPDYYVGYDEAWCDLCVSSAAVVAGCVDLIGVQATVPYHIDIFKKKGIWIEDGTITPKPGYVIVFSWSKWYQPNNDSGDHIGFVESVNYSARTITTIEGNKDGAVKRRTFPIGWGYIRGYAAPNYPVKRK